MNRAIRTSQHGKGDGSEDFAKSVGKRPAMARIVCGG